MTEYSKAWADFIMTNEYHRCVLAMEKKNMSQPYIDNILKTAFDAGYNYSRPNDTSTNK